MKSITFQLLISCFITQAFCQEVDSTLVILKHTLDNQKQEQLGELLTLEIEMTSYESFNRYVWFFDDQFNLKFGEHYVDLEGNYEFNFTYFEDSKNLVLVSKKEEFGDELTEKLLHKTEDGVLITVFPDGTELTPLKNNEFLQVNNRIMAVFENHLKMAKEYVKDESLPGLLTLKANVEIFMSDDLLPFLSY